MLAAELLWEGERLKAAQLVGRKLFEFIEVDMPTIQDGECLTKLERVSICAAIFATARPRYPGGEDYPLEVGRPCRECAGVVAKPNGRLPCGAAGHCPARRWHGRLDRVPRRLSGPADRLARPWRPDGVGHVPACRHVLYACQRMGSVLGKSVLIMGPEPLACRSPCSPPCKGRGR